METTEIARIRRYSYVIHYYGHLMTRPEHLAYKILNLTKRMRGRTDVQAQIEARKLLQDPARLEAFKPFLMDHGAWRLASEVSEAFKLYDDPEVLHLASEGLQVFVTRTVQRILAEHPDKVAFNNCPRCSALARTPRARQCRFCGFDWHAV